MSTEVTSCRLMSVARAGRNAGVYARIPASRRGARFANNWEGTLDTKIAALPLGAPFAFAARIPHFYFGAHRGLSSLLMSAIASLALTACGGGGGGAAAPATYSVTADVSGLTGSGLNLSLNGSPAITASGNGSVSLTTGLANGTSYAVTITASPVNPSETCTISNGMGQVSGANVVVGIGCTTANTSPASVNVVIDPALPASLSGKVTQIATPAGAGAFNAWIPVALGSGGESLALALDANNNIIGASLVTGPNATISADSTALAFARLWIGDIPTALSPSALNSAIRASAGYPALVALIKQDLSTGVTPISDSAVISGLAGVVTSLSSQTFQASAAHASKFVTGTPVPAIPFTAISDSFGGSSGVQITAEANHTITIYNAMLIPWDATTKIANPQTMLGGPSPVLSGSAIALPAYNDAFNLLLAQDATTATRIERDALYGTINTVSEFLPEGCNLSLIKTGIQQLVESFSGTEAPSYGALTEAINSFWSVKNTTSILGGCVPKGSPVFYLAASEALEIFAALETIFKEAGTVVELSEADYYLGQANSQGNPVFALCGNGGWQVASCATDFQFQNLLGNPITSITLAPGGLGSFSIAALVAGSGQLSVLPGNLTVTPVGDSTVAAISSLTSGLGSITGGTNLNGGPLQVTASDATLGVTGTVPLNVYLVWPNISPQSQNFIVGTQPASVTVQFVDSSGNPVIIPINAKAQQVSGNTTLGFNNIGPSGTTMNWLVPADNVVTGSVQIAITDPNGVPYGNSPAIINIVSTPTSMQLQSNPPSLASPPGSVTLTATVTAKSPAPSGPSTPAGTVTFTDQSGVVLCNAYPTSNGVAQCPAQINTTPDTVTATFNDPTYLYGQISAMTTITSGPFALDPASINVALTLSDLGPDGAGGLTSGPGYGSQSCAAPCYNFTSSGGSYGATVAFTDVWGLESGTWTFSSSLQGSVTITTGTSALFTADVNWSAPAGPFQGGFSGGFSFTIGQPYSVSVTPMCTESSSVTNTCGGSLPAGKIQTPGGVPVQPQSSGPTGSQYALAAGNYIFTWGIVGGSDLSCCLGAPDQGTGPTATATASLKALFQPSQ
jgi:hypothetical protein